MEGNKRTRPPTRDVTTSDIQAPSPSSTSTDLNQKPDPDLNRIRSRTSFQPNRSSKQESLKSPLSDFLDNIPIVQCPVCVEPMVTPKILPCLHNICKKCLQNHILTQLREEIQKDMTPKHFNCPVCNETIDPPNAELGCEKWGSMFPTNFFLHTYGMILSVMKGDVDCDPCFRRGETTLAAWWCSECCEYQCNVCKTVHSGFKTFKHHAVVSVKEIAENPDLAVPKHEPCIEHREKITKYCREHRTACCGSCLATDHRKCESVVSIEAQFDAMKARGDFTALTTLLVNYEMMATEMVDFRKTIMENVETKRIEIIETMQLIREGFEKDLKQLENNLLKDFEDFHSKEMEQLAYLKQESKNIEQQISNALNLIKTVEKFGSETHMVTLADKIEPECGRYERALRNSQDQLKSVSYTFNIDPLLANVFKTITQFGNISLDRLDQPPQNLVVAKPLQKEHAVEMERLHVVMAGDRGRCGIMGGVYFRDGRILLADYDNFKLKLFHDNGRNLGKLVLKSKPSDITMIDEETFVVTYPSANGIQFIHLKGNVIQEGDFIKTGRKYHGLSYCDGKLYLVANTGIAIYSSDGNQQGYLKLQEKGTSVFLAPSHIKATTNALFVTDHGKNSVIVLSPDGKLLYTIKSKEISYPCGLDLDDHGDVFVCCKQSSNIHQCTGSGERVKILLSEKDGLQNPLFICFQKFYNKFFVSESKGADRDYIKIFEWA